MCPHQIEGSEIANALVKFGRASEVREEEGQAGDFQSLIHVERVGLVDIPKRLIRQESFGGEEGAA